MILRQNSSILLTLVLAMLGNVGCLQASDAQSSEKEIELLRRWALKTRSGFTAVVLDRDHEMVPDAALLEIQRLKKLAQQESIDTANRRYHREFVINEDDPSGMSDSVYSVASAKSASAKKVPQAISNWTDEEKAAQAKKQEEKEFYRKELRDRSMRMVEEMGLLEQLERSTNPEERVDLRNRIADILGMKRPGGHGFQAKYGFRDQEGQDLQLLVVPRDGKSAVVRPEYVLGRRNNIRVVVVEEPTMDVINSLNRPSDALTPQVPKKAKVSCNNCCW